METTMPEIALEGCAPVPLAAYLKALGIFRIVAEQKDENVHGFWREEAFVLDTAVMKENLVHFFLDNYRPSPIISPWNGGSGFYYREGKSNEKDPTTGKKIKTGVRDEATAATKTLNLIADSRADRFRSLRAIIDEVRHTLKELGYTQALQTSRNRVSLSFFAVLFLTRGWNGLMQPSRSVPTTSISHHSWAPAGMMEI
jgi:CRISPR-associated protein Csx17